MSGSGKSSHHDPTVSAGAAAGIADANFVLGALAALLVSCLFARRPKKNRPMNDGAVASKDIEIPFQDHDILERADDSQLRNQMQDLGEHIYQHVEDHYILGSSSTRIHREDFRAGLMKCGYSEQTSPSVSTLGSLLVSTNQRRMAIKSVIAWVVLRAAELDNGFEYSLVPDEVTRFYYAVCSGSKQLNERDGMYYLSLART